MYQVSEQYENQIKKTARNYSYIKVRFGITDPDADAAAVLAQNGQMPWSVLPEIEDVNTVSARYATLEHNRWLLNGNQKIIPNNNHYMYQAFVGDKVSDENGEFDTYTDLTIEFGGGAYAFSGLSFSFDTILNDYPAEINVRGYYQEALIYDKQSSVTGVNYVFDQRIPESDAFVDKLVIRFTKTNAPNRRIRVEDLTLGIIKILTESRIISATWSRSNDLMNTVLPQESFSFTFYDVNREYNPDNPEGLWEYMETGQPVKFWFGYQLDDESIEWIPGSNYIIDGSPKVANGDSLSQVTFNTISPIQNLTSIYDEGVYSATGTTLYDLADRILQWSGVLDSYGNKKYLLDESLKNYVVHNPLPVLPVKELMQLIANEGMCVMFTSRSGFIVLSPRLSTDSGFVFSLSDVKNTSPEVSKYPYLHTLSVKVSDLVPETSVSEITSVEIDNLSSATIIVEHDAATNISVEGSSGVTINNIIGLYAYRSKIVVSGTGKITIKGNKLIPREYLLSKVYNPVGEDCALESKLMQDRNHAEQYLDWMADVLKKRNVYSFDDRGFPELDIADIISTDTAFTDDKKVNLTSYKVTFNGGLSGTAQVLG